MPQNTVHTTTRATIPKPSGAGIRVLGCITYPGSALLLRRIPLIALEISVSQRGIE